MASDDTSPRTSLVPSPPQKPKGISRKKKSPSQTDVLERAYAVEKYPSETTRTFLGKELDLSDKQLQIWFTHRRYKDRRDGIDDEKLTFYAKDRIDSHVPNSHMLTEECRSSQKVEGVPTPMEVNDDSEPSGYPALVLAEERDDEELIAEHEYTNRMVGPCNGSYAEVGKIKASPNRKSAPRLPKDPTKPPRRPGPKPKFNAIAAAERVAVSAVESQLCGPLREDGPPLGFEFDPLPPRAFQEFLILEAPFNAELSREGGSENYNERTAWQSKWTMEHELVEKKRKAGFLRAS
jgi:hypothetical protein